MLLPSKRLLTVGPVEGFSLLFGVHLAAMLCRWPAVTGFLPAGSAIRAVATYTLWLHSHNRIRESISPGPSPQMGKRRHRPMLHSDWATEWASELTQEFFSPPH